LAIAVLILWIATAVAGLTLLRAGGAARAAAETVPTEPLVTASARSAAVPLTADGRPPPGPHIRVATPSGEHPLLEFSHPALAVTGIACWLMFTFIHYEPLAWIAFGVLVVTLGIGLLWLVRNRRAARRHPTAAWNFPPRLIAVHGIVATCSIALTVLAAMVASHG
jgi:hypothetical protein